MTFISATSTMDFSNTPPQFIFPVLKSADILQCMSELEIEITKAELAEPQRHREKLRKVFLRLLETCCGTIESDLEPSPAASEKAASMPYAELHDVSRDIKLFRLLRKLMRTCGIYDFSWKDLQTPNSKRLRWQLSAVINMAKYREDQLGVYAELSEPRAEFLLNLEDVNKEHIQLKTQLEEVEAQAEEDFLAMEEVAKECEALTGQIAHSNKLQASKREEAAALKRKANDLKDELATATWALEEVEAEESRLSTQVVSSPDRRQKELIAKREALDREKEECAVLEEDVQRTKTMCHHVGEATKSIQTEIKVAEAVKEEAKKFVEAANKLDKALRELEVKKQQVAHAIEETVLCEKDLNRTEEKLTSLQKQSKMRLEAAQQSLEAAKQSLDKVERDRRNGMKQVESGDLRIREIEAQMEEERLESQREVEAMIAEFHETEKLVFRRLNNRMQSMEQGKENSP